MEIVASTKADSLVSAERLVASMHSSMLSVADKSSKRLSELQSTLQERNDELELYLLEKQVLIKANSHAFSLSDAQAIQIPKLEAVIEAQKSLMNTLKDRAQSIGSLFSHHVKQISQLLVEVVADRDQLVKQLHVERVSREAIEALYQNAKETTNKALKDQDVLIRHLRESWTESEIEMARMREAALLKSEEDSKATSFMQPPRIARVVSEQRKEGERNSLVEVNLIRKVLGGKINEEKLFPLLEVLTEYQSQKQELEEYREMLEERNREAEEMEELKKKYNEALSKYSSLEANQGHGFLLESLGTQNSLVAFESNEQRIRRASSDKMEEEPTYKAIIASLEKRLKELEKTLSNREENLSLLMMVHMEARKKIYELDPEFNQESLILKNRRVPSNLLKKRQTNDLYLEITDLYKKVRRLERQLSQSASKPRAQGGVIESQLAIPQDSQRETLASVSGGSRMQVESGKDRKHQENFKGGSQSNRENSLAHFQKGLHVEKQGSLGSEKLSLVSKGNQNELKTPRTIDFADAQVVEELLRANQSETQDDQFYKKEALNARKKLNEAECRVLVLERELKETRMEREKLDKIIGSYEEIINEPFLETAKPSCQEVETKTWELLLKLEEIYERTSDSGEKLAEETIKWRQVLRDTVESKETLLELVKVLFGKLKDFKEKAKEEMEGVLEEREKHKGESEALCELLRVTTEEGKITREGLELQLETIRVVNSCLSARVTTLNNVVEQYYSRIQDLLIEREKQNKNEELQKIKMILEEENKELQRIKETYSSKTERLEGLEKDFDLVFKSRVTETEKLQEVFQVQFEEMKKMNEKRFEELAKKRDEFIEETHSKVTMEREENSKMAQSFQKMKEEFEKAKETIQSEAEKRKETQKTIEHLKTESSQLMKEKNSMLLGMSLREAIVDFAKKIGLAQAESIKSSSELATQQKEILRVKCQELESELTKVKGDFGRLGTQFKDEVGRLSEECERLSSLKSDAETNLKRFKNDRDLAEMRAHELEKVKTELEEKLRRLEELKGDKMQEEIGIEGIGGVSIPEKRSPKEIMFDEEKDEVENENAMEEGGDQEEIGMNIENNEESG